MSLSAQPVGAKVTSNPAMDDVGYAWVVIRFNFACPSEGRNKPEAIVVVQWGDRREKRWHFSCKTNPRSPLYHAKGVVFRFSTRYRPPLAELRPRIALLVALTRRNQVNGIMISI